MALYEISRAGALEARQRLSHKRKNYFLFGKKRSANKKITNGISSGNVNIYVEWNEESQRAFPFFYSPHSLVNRSRASCENIIKGVEVHNVSWTGKETLTLFLHFEGETETFSIRQISLNLWVFPTSPTKSWFPVFLCTKYFCFLERQDYPPVSPIVEREELGTILFAFKWIFSAPICDDSIY